MNKFTQAAGSAVALSAKEMKNVKGGGNCGFQPTDSQGRAAGPMECGLDESDYSSMMNMYGNGDWCCSNCSGSGITC